MIHMAFGHANRENSLPEQFIGFDMTNDDVKRPKRERLVGNAGDISANLVSRWSGTDILDMDGTVVAEAMAAAGRAQAVGGGTGFMVVRGSISASKRLRSWDSTWQVTAREAMTQRERAGFYALAAAALAMVAIGAILSSLAIATAGIGLLVTLAVGILELRAHT